MVKEEEVLFKGNPQIEYPRPPGRTLSFKCFKCPSIFDRKESLLTHTSLHGAKKRFRCHMCDYSVNSAELLTKHMTKHRSLKEKRSPKSESTVNVRGRWRENESPKQLEVEATEEMRMDKKCQECPAKFKSSQSLRSHVQNHGNGQRYKCGKCSYANRSRVNLHKHLLLHQDIKSSILLQLICKCVECPAVFHNERDLGRHMENHGVGDKYSCESCSFSVNRQDLLDDHAFLHKKTQTLNQNSQELEREKPQRKRKAGLDYTCAKCPHRASNRVDLERHITAHGAKRAFTCAHCDFSVRVNSIKKKHEELHTDSPNLLPLSKVASKIVSRSFKAARKATHTYPLVDRRRDGRAAAELSFEEYTEIRRGNPAIGYEPFKKLNKQSKSIFLSAFKCLYCPYRTTHISTYFSHQTYHDGRKRKFSCIRCNYSNDGKKTFEAHLNSHEASDRIIEKRGRENGMNKSNSVPSNERTHVPQSITIEKTETTVGIVMEEDVVKSRKSFQEAYSVEPFDAVENESKNYLVERMVVRDFMSIEVLDLETTNILTFQGNGKSSSLVAILVGIGYDVLVKDQDPRSICGLSVADFIREGAKCCYIELTLSLHASSKLQREFGSHLKVVRRLYRGLPLSSSYFELTSADSKGRFPRESQLVRKERIRKVLKHLHILPVYFHLMLLDRENLFHVLNHPHQWYGYYEATYESRKAKIESRLDMLMLKFSRLQGEIQWRNVKNEFLTEQLSSQTKEVWREGDRIAKEELQAELGRIYERHDVLESGVNSYLNELNKLSKTMSGRLKFRYQEFLHRQNYVGSILVDEKKKTLGIWIGDISFVDVPPSTVEEAMSLWTATPMSQKELAVIGLYFALIDILDSSPLFFIDSSSSRATEFKLPPKALPLLFELIEKKCSSGHQFVTSLPDEPILGL